MAWVKGLISRGMAVKAYSLQHGLQSGGACITFGLAGDKIQSYGHRLRVGSSSWGRL